MSHYTVLVVAENHAELEFLLLPYHEYESTGIVEYTEFVPVDMTELQEKYAEFGDGRTLDEFAKEWGGYTRNEEGVLGRLTNPDARWDWWQIGGRWANLLLLKDGSRASLADAGNVDWKAMRHNEEEVARERYRTWKSLPDRATNEKAWKDALMRSSLFLISEAEVEMLNALSEEEYVARYGSAQALTYALLDENGWKARGKMGWWGISHDEVDEYDAQWWATVEALRPDQTVFVVDCHI